MSLSLLQTMDLVVMGNGNEEFCLFEYPFAFWGLLVLSYL